MCRGIIDNWISSENPDKSTLAIRLKRIYELQAVYLFDQYEPNKTNCDLDGVNFIDRLEEWLSQFKDDEHRWVAFTTFRYFLFLGKNESDELYRTAVQHHFVPWLIEKENINIYDANKAKLLKAAIEKSWPCPLTDSLRINSLLHLAGFNGKKIRPDWLSLEKLADDNKLGKYVEDYEIEYLILFEDFVGSGAQASAVLSYAIEKFKGYIFFCPLVICHQGLEQIQELESSSKGRLTIDPVITLMKDCTINDNTCEYEPKSFEDLRSAIVAASESAKYRYNKNSEDGPFGWGNTGAMYSSYSNCPNNTPYIYHKSSKRWPRPLFPRMGRNSS